MQLTRQALGAPSEPKREAYGDMETWKVQGRGREGRREKRKGQEKNRECKESERREKILRVKKGGGRRTPQKTGPVER